MQSQSEEEPNAIPRSVKSDSSMKSEHFQSAQRSPPNRSAKSPPEFPPEAQSRGPKHAARTPPSTLIQQDPPSWSTGSLGSLTGALVCAMDNGSTKLRIPLKLVHRTHAVTMLLGSPDGTASSPVAQRRASSAATAPSEALENSVSVNLQLPQPIPTPGQDDAMIPPPALLGSTARLRSSTRSADDADGGNNLSNPVNEGSWAQRSPSHGAGGQNSFRQEDSARGDHNDDSWLLSGEHSAAASSTTVKLQNVIHVLREGLASPTPPAVCRLFQDSKCRQGQRCHQIHVPRGALESLRQEVRARGNCCWGHDSTNPGGREEEDPTWRWKFAMVHEALPRLRSISIMLNGGTSVAAGGGATSGEGAMVTPPTALSLPTLGPSQHSAQGLSTTHLDPARSMERSGPNLVTSIGPESSLELSLTSTPFLSQPGVAPVLPSPKYTSGASYSGEFAGSGDDRSHRAAASLGEPLSIALDKQQLVTTKSLITPSQISPTLGLCTTVVELLELHVKSPTQPPSLGPGLEIPYASLCRLHLRGPVCKFGDLCRYVHVCRQAHSAMATIRSPAAGTTDRPLPADGAPPAPNRIVRSPGGSGQLFSSVAATNGASSGSRTNVGSSSGGARSDAPHAKTRSSSSDEEQQLSHVLLPCPTPPPPNVQMKIWQNMPYHFRRKKPSKTGGQPSQKTAPSATIEKPEKK